MAISGTLFLFLIIDIILIDLVYSVEGINFNNTVINITNESNDVEELNRDNRVLSRRKRFLVFPDGSSFQLVFCAQNQGYFGIGDIFWLGNTAALAWELPNDPKIFYMFKDFKQFGQRRGDVEKNIYYLDDKGKTIAKVPYKKRITVNPAFAKRKRSVDHFEDRNMISKAEMHELHQKENVLICKNSEDCNADFHREVRRSLYEKLETYIDALGWQGRQCVLRMLCEAGKDKSEQGTFLDEIVRTVFTLPGGQQFHREQHKQYDIAHNANGDCGLLYPECVNKLTGQPLYS